MYVPLGAKLPGLRVALVRLHLSDIRLLHLLYDDHPSEKRTAGTRPACPAPARPLGGRPGNRLPATCGLAPCLWLPGVACAGERADRSIAVHRAIACAVPSIRTP